MGDDLDAPLAEAERFLHTGFVPSGVARRLAAAVRGLREENERTKGAYQTAHDLSKHWAARAVAAEAQRDRLAAALREERALCDRLGDAMESDEHWKDSDVHADALDAWRDARQALAGSTETEGT